MFSGFAAQLYEATPNGAAGFVDDPAVFFTLVIGKLFDGFALDFVGIEPFDGRCDGGLQFLRRVFYGHQERKQAGRFTAADGG